MHKRYKSKLVDERLKDDYGNVIHNVRGHTFHNNSYGYNNKVYKSKTLPKAPDYSPDTYDYDFAKDAIAVKNLVMHNQARTASNQAGHTGFPIMGYDELRGYVYPIQKHLIAIGYLDEGDDDGIMGPKTEGAIKRYDFNRPSIFEEAWHGIKNMDMNPFD